MVEFINSWTQQIIVAVVICTIIEMILPEGKNKKYIRAIMGIYIVFNIISPIIGKGKNIHLNFDLKNNQNETIATNASINTNKYIENIYIEKIENDIRASLKEKKYNVDSIKVEIETTDESKYGTILSISIYVSKQQEEKENTICIKKIEIGNDKITENENKISNEEKENIKKYLSERYHIDIKEIEVI